MVGMSRAAPAGRAGSMSRDGRPDPATEAFLALRPKPREAVGTPGVRAAGRSLRRS
jgi:hypothetical protein